MGKDKHCIKAEDRIGKTRFYADYGLCIWARYRIPSRFRCQEPDDGFKGSNSKLTFASCQRGER